MKLRIAFYIFSCHWFHLPYYFHPWFTNGGTINKPLSGCLISALFDFFSLSKWLSFHALVQPKSMFTQPHPLLITSTANSRPSVIYIIGQLSGDVGVNSPVFPVGSWNHLDTQIFCAVSFSFFGPRSPVPQNICF